MGKRRLNEKQGVRLLSETGNVVDIKFDADLGYVASPDTPEAWGLNRTQQAKELRTGQFIQLICERSGKPIQVFRNSGSTNDIIGYDISTIANQAEDRAQQESERDRPKDSQLLWLGIITTIIAIAFLLVVWKMVL